MEIKTIPKLVIDNQKICLILSPECHVSLNFIEPINIIILQNQYIGPRGIHFNILERGKNYFLYQFAALIN